ncbi:hypothetical protein MMC19_004050 [Ptychographa xylographoides]|nr:hypothetical protein [Ptychographa xylographoides]
MPSSGLAVTESTSPLTAQHLSLGLVYPSGAIDAYEAPQTARSASLFPASAPMTMRSTQYSPGSHQSEHSSLYLSPPATDSDSERPPYKPDSNDVSSLNMHTKKKKRVKNRFLRKGYTLILGYMSDQSPPHHSKNGTKSLSAASLLEPLDTYSDDSGYHGSAELNPSEFLMPPGSRQQDQSSRLDLKALCDPSIFEAPSTLRESITSRLRGQNLSVARETSQRAARKMQRRWSLTGDASLPSLTFATAFASLIAENKMFFTSRSSSKGISDSKAKLITSLGFGATSSTVAEEHTARSQGRRIDTPATIVLRRVSRTYHCGGPKRVSEAIRRTTTDRSFETVQIPIAIHNNPNQTRVSGSSSPGRSFPIITNGKWSTSPKSCMSDINSSKLCDPPVNRRQSLPADPALTFAEVQTAPMSFTMCGASRKHSLLAIETMRRSSTAQIRSGNGVCEIIWNKDDSPSTRSSRSSNFSPRVLQEAWTGSSLEIASSDISPRKQSLDCSNTRDHVLPNSTATATDDNTVYYASVSRSNRSGWSWNSQKFNKDSNRVTNAPQQIIRPPRSKSRRGRWSRTWKEPAPHPMPSIESFPPLLERHSTQEWRKAPLVDLNNPIAGRNQSDVPETVPASTASSNTTNTVHDGDWNHAPGRAQSQVDLIARKSSKFGAAIGASCHLRRASATPSLIAALSPAVHFSTNMPRKSSNISHSSLDATWAIQPHQQISPTSGLPNRSVDQFHPQISFLVDEDYPTIVRRSSPGESWKPTWRKSNSSGLRVDTSGELYRPRVIQTAGIEETLDRVEIVP